MLSEYTLSTASSTTLGLTFDTRGFSSVCFTVSGLGSGETVSIALVNGVHADPILKPDGSTFEFTDAEAQCLLAGGYTYRVTGKSSTSTPLRLSVNHCSTQVT